MFNAVLTLSSPLCRRDTRRLRIYQKGARGIETLGPTQNLRDRDLYLWLVGIQTGAYALPV